MRRSERVLAKKALSPVSKVESKKKYPTAKEKKEYLQALLAEEINVEDLVKKDPRLKKKTVQKWIQRYRKGEFTGEVGRRRALGTPEIESVKESSGGRIKKTTVEVITIINEKRAKREEILSNRSSAQVPEVSKSTARRIFQKAGMAKGKADATTQARAKACADIQNAMSFAAAQHLMIGKLPHRCGALNVDGSQFKGGNISGGKVEVVYVKDEHDGNLKAMPNDSSSGLTAYFVKYYAAIACDGSCWKPIFIVADDNMTEDTIDFYVVKGMGLSNSVCEEGYLVFCKSRVPPAQFYEWFMLEQLIPFCKELRKRHGLSDRSMFWLNLDGELKQIFCFFASQESMNADEAIENSKVLKAFDDENIRVGKPAGSTTEITQSLDRGKTFLGTKAIMKGITDADVADDEELKTELEEAYRQHELKIGKQMSRSHKTLGILTLLKAVLALQENVKRRIIWESFKDVGIYDKDCRGYNWKTILANCTTRLEPTEQTEFCAAIPEMAKILNKQGELLQKDFMKIPLFQRAKFACPDKDDHVIQQRRFVILNHKEVLEREINKREKRKSEAVDKEAKQAEKKRKKEEEAEAKAKKQKEKEEKAKEKADEAKAKKEAKEAAKQSKVSARKSK